MFEFENLTFAPIDRNLIAAESLSQGELKWLNEYHATVYEKLEPLLDNDTKAWLKKATAPIMP